MRELVRPPKALPGERIAILSPSFAAPAVSPALHEQAMCRLRDLTGLEPVEYPTTRQLGASARDRARDINAAFADPTVRAILATVGGDDQITVIPHLDPTLPVTDPKPVLGYSDNTNLHHWLWSLGIASFYGGSTQVHLGPGPGVDDVHARSLRASLLSGVTLQVTEPGESEDFGRDWSDPRALTEYGAREPTDPWTWAGPGRRIVGRTWGGCLDSLPALFIAGRTTVAAADVAGSVLLLETAEELMPPLEVGRTLRALGERGLLEAVGAVVVARPPTSSFTDRPGADVRAQRRIDQRDTVIEVVERYNPDAVICVGPPFGHTRPQWIVPHGGFMTVDGAEKTITADYA